MSHHYELTQDGRDALVARIHDHREAVDGLARPWCGCHDGRPSPGRSAVGSNETLFLDRTTMQEEDDRNVPVGGPAE